MKTKQDIIDYLGLCMSEDQVGKEGIAENKKYISAAEKIEMLYAAELSEGIYGYGLDCDFVNCPNILEDETRLPLLEIANYDSVVVYKKSKIENPEF